MITMLQSLFAIGIIFLCILTNIRGEQSRVYPTNEQYEWFNAKDKCRLLANERNFSTFPKRLGWTNFSAKYLPWVEYLGCFEFRNVDTSYRLKKQVTKGEQLQECIVHCNSSQFFGLQKSSCLCLHSPNQTDLHTYIVTSCDTEAVTCLGDPFGFCGTEVSSKFLSVYQKASVHIHDRFGSNLGNCLEFDSTRGIFKAKECSKKLFPVCYDEIHKHFGEGNRPKSNWTDAFTNCQTGSLASYSTAIGKINELTRKFSDQFWLSNIRRWENIIDVTGNPFFCVAARIKQKGVVEKSIHECRKHLPALCVEVRKTSTDAPSNKSSARSIGTTSSGGIKNTSSSLQSKPQGLTMFTYSASFRSTLSSQSVASTPTLKRTTGRSTVIDRKSTFSFQIVSTTLVKKKITGRSKVVKETTSSTPDWKETTSPVQDESTSTDLPGEESVSTILIIVIVAATILIVIIILVTIVLCRRKKNTEVPISNESLAMVGKEVMYAQVNKPTVKREQSTSSQKPQPAASDDTYDHMDHRRLSQTHNPTESNYDTMRSIANAGEEENNYDHVTGTKMEPQRFVVDGVSNYSHVEVECHEVKDI